MIITDGWRPAPEEITRNLLRPSPRSKKWQCPACGEVEAGEFVLGINHGWYVGRDPGYWWKRHGCCMKQYRHLMHNLGWWPRGWGPRKDMVELGCVLTYEQQDEIHRLFRSGYWIPREQQAEEVADKIAEHLTPVIMNRLPAVEAEDMMEVYDRVEEKVKARVHRALDAAMAAAEAEGFPLGDGDSIDRALAAMVDSFAVRTEGAA